jgi:hypothetical protein
MPRHVKSPAERGGRKSNEPSLLITRNSVTEAKDEIKLNGGLWPAPSAGMGCFAECYQGDSWYSVLLDVHKGLVDGEYRSRCPFPETGVG